METFSTTSAIYSIDFNWTLHPDVTLPMDDVVDPISDAMILTYRKVFLGVMLFISPVGISTNIINIVTFIKIGLVDSVTISFFFLALSDLFICTLNFIGTTSSVVDAIAMEQRIWLYTSPFIPSVYTAYLRKMFGFTTISITSFLAVQRCLCVVLPFTVKNMFNKFRTYCYIAVTSTVIIVFMLLVTVRHRVHEVTNKYTNATQLQIYLIPGSETYTSLFGVVGSIVFGTVCPLLVLLCLVIIAVGLQKSKRFRKSASDSERGIKSPKSQIDQSEGKRASKETQALIQVGLLSVIFFVTSLPSLGTGLAMILVPGFYMHGRYHNVYHLTVFVSLTGDLINSTVNFFVYYKYNSKFKNMCSSWLGQKSIPDE